MRNYGAHEVRLQNKTFLWWSKKLVHSTTVIGILPLLFAQERLCNDSPRIDTDWDQAITRVEGVVLNARIYIDPGKHLCRSKYPR